jgi:hypothetical protein
LLSPPWLNLPISHLLAWGIWLYGCTLEPLSAWQELAYGDSARVGVTRVEPTSDVQIGGVR